MNTFRIEAVGDREDKSLTMPKLETICDILEGLSKICSGKESGTGFDLTPEGGFDVPRKRTSKDRIFRVSDFEGRRTVKDERTEYDGGPGRGGLDLLGKYTSSNSMVTIYVDSCRRVELEYCEGSWLKELIKVVLIHELAHLITHKGFDPQNLGDETDHVSGVHRSVCDVCYPIEQNDEKALEVFERLSPHQPFIYRTWEGLKAVESVHSKKLIGDVVKSVFNTLILPPAERGNLGVTGYDE